MGSTGSPILPGLGSALVTLLETRSGKSTLICLADGQQLLSRTFAWGRDFNEDWEHVYLNSSPPEPGLPVHFVQTQDVVEARDAVTGEVLYVRPTEPSSETIRSRD